MTGIECVRVLHGHTSQDSAYLVDDYPYGRRLRCKIRYWIGTAEKGAKKGQQRFMSQTTDARRGNTAWNNPKGSTYALLAVMYLNAEDHVTWSGVSELGATPQGDAWFRMRGIYEQLTDEQRAHYDLLIRIAQRYATPWREWEQKVADLAAHLQETGEDPTIDNGVWTAPGGTLSYLGTENVPVYLAAARQHLAVIGG